MRFPIFVIGILKFQDRVGNITPIMLNVKSDENSKSVYARRAAENLL